MSLSALRMEGREREDEGGTAMMNDKSEWFGVKIVSVEFKQE